MTPYIAILTVNDKANYGNRLQNYALQELLRPYGSVTTIRMRPGSINLSGCLKNRLQNVLHLIRNRLRLIQGGSQRLEGRRRLSFLSFTKTRVPDNLLFLTAQKGLENPSHLAIGTIVIGSDQVWNYQYLPMEDLALRLGSFVPKDVRLISYAASIGASAVDDIKAREVFRTYLPRLQSVSVREDRAREIVLEIAKLEATVVLDPTLMLHTDFWRSITRGFVPNDDKYVLTYFLGHPSAAQEEAIQKYASDHSCRIRRILDSSDPQTYVAGPQDFVELFSKAQYVFTDSYHACCFSILFHKQFTVFNRAGMGGRASMNSRMETLFRLFELDSVMIDSGLAPEIDYGKVDRLLEQRRKESQAWLDKALEA